MKLTPWYPPNIKPVRPGVYEAQWGSSKLWEDWPYSYWTGEEWANSGATPEEALRLKNWTLGANQSKKWRGLAKEPK